MKERKPRTTKEAGRLAEGYCQARKVELWAPAPKTSAKRSTHVMRGCYVCGQLGHLARDCSNNTTSGNSSSKKVNPSTSSKGEDVMKVEKRLRKDEKLLVCYNCRGYGHM